MKLMCFQRDFFLKEKLMIGEELSIRGSHVILK